MKVHTLKTWPGVFAEVLNGDKTFEYRLNDRDFSIGDVLFLTLYDDENDKLHENIYIRRRVTSILRGPDFGVPEGYCVMSIKEVK